MNDELYHYGVKGMKWGVRRKQKSTPKTSWGKNRQYAKEQDAISKQRWKDTKAKVKSGELSKNSSTYKKERQRAIDYNRQRYNATVSLGMTKAARGKFMKQMKISADKPISSLSVDKEYAARVDAYTKQFRKYSLASLATQTLVGVGSKYVSDTILRKSLDQKPRSSNDNIINLKPNQYKVYDR